MALAQLVRLADAQGALTNKVAELAGAQITMVDAAQGAHDYVQEAIPTILGALDEFDERIKVLEEKLGVATPVLDNEGETP